MCPLGNTYTIRHLKKSPDSNIPAVIERITRILEVISVFHSFCDIHILQEENYDLCK